MSFPSLINPCDAAKSRRGDQGRLPGAAEQDPHRYREPGAAAGEPHFPSPFLSMGPNPRPAIFRFAIGGGGANAREQEVSKRDSNVDPDEVAKARQVVADMKGSYN